ncbi:hypothetical protein KC367_g9237 [Hortaea werneckii]|nr:hypothetical protein KC338_g8946 [Hortaea werneckii]KAI7492058.1 hypothetical protein KC367_g9237 [Hortaea werneckii]KAI7535774.1 hypothetical protein KC331_g11852 [Hortaea werneckii]
MVVRGNEDCINGHETLVRDGIEREGWVCLESRSATEGFDVHVVDYTCIVAQDRVSTIEPDDPQRGKLQTLFASPKHPLERRLILAEQDDPLCRIAAGISTPRHNDKPPRKRKRDDPNQGKID